MRFSAYPFDLITYRPEGAVYFVTDTLTAVKRFVLLASTVNRCCQFYMSV